MYVYVYMYVYVCICIYVRICMYVCICVYVYMYVYVCMCVYVCMYICEYMYICICVYVCMCMYVCMYRVFNLKVDRILIWVIHLLRFTTCYITQLTYIYSKCWKWCPFISVHLSTRFTMFLATFLSVLSLFNNFRNSAFYWRLPSKFFKQTLSTVGVRHRF